MDENLQKLREQALLGSPKEKDIYINTLERLLPSTNTKHFRWWEKDGMAHTIIKLDHKLGTLRINLTRRFYSRLQIDPNIFIRLELLTFNGWDTLHEINAGTEHQFDCKLFDSSLQKYVVEMTRYAEAIFSGAFNTEENQNGCPTILILEVKNENLK